MYQQNYVWYASYGSNINRDRFLCYIKGGIPVGSTKMERGCRDQSLPVDEQAFIMHHQLYFAKEAERWNRQGVCFIDLECDQRFKTYSQMYLITRAQFLDVLGQENNMEQVELDLEEVMGKKSKVFRASWYGNILYLGDKGGSPIFTFTTTSPLNREELNRPSSEYLRTIVIGMKKKLGLTQSEIVDYFIDKPGIQGNMDREALEMLVDDAKE
ncbi:hypothetical protein GCM10011391_07830 [Pullulanibacillus camelliae]|uniref:Histone deacetylase n=1 Tax=Pullulanibacillus camelliae TaxID=1707096 RepID=A0A8J2YFC1_9BACL|nr:hypothetical protein [Pullulanibacillus camelliae]GGE31582.1 hypothetical protein GCM10011391_07830 [Pullulanibacillus camelliae]